MADEVQFRLERMANELEDLEKRGLMEWDKINEIVKQRREFEYRLQRPSPLKKDFLDYIEFEKKLEAYRKCRKRMIIRQMKEEDEEVGGKKKRYKKWKKSLSDSAGIVRIMGLYKMAVSRFKGDLGLWFQYLEFCRERRHGRMKEVCDPTPQPSSTVLNFIASPFQTVHRKLHPPIPTAAGRHQPLTPSTRSFGDPASDSAAEALTRRVEAQEQLVASLHASLLVLHAKFDTLQPSAASSANGSACLAADTSILGATPLPDIGDSAVPLLLGRPTLALDLPTFAGVDRGPDLRHQLLSLLLPLRQSDRPLSDSPPASWTTSVERVVFQLPSTYSPTHICAIKEFRAIIDDVDPEVTVMGLPLSPCDRRRSYDSEAKML
ncbi:hypothetical protein KSP40_PGU003869 [Platanthera guangdongensis]|uniref:U3 small nucleolar RNA-associated protein 6 N-terminal domain-containing protein n=1 Tax=Platanthera guangdongensis TaxID=2320717 RepID=A0ABR2N391_9ASPA